MPTTGMTDGHTHPYPPGRNRAMSWNVNGHSHSIPPYPATETEEANGHTHPLPRREDEIQKLKDQNNSPSFD